ncbi:hypothetical protein HJFPF1_12418 [Paramyrothecium foliicola]|nr:hypothetical protein HJFPF1_12418 [Paramyrothecium foliicola]
MADPLSVVSGLLAIVTATIQSSKVLYQTIQSFRDHPRSVRQLIAELGALDGVLKSLEEFAGGEPLVLVPLKLPLEQCAKACADFYVLISKCTKHSARHGSTSFRDWARLRYMDSDINGFTAMLAGYKSTIAIALADANLRSSTVTLQVLNEYKDMIRNTKQDLEDHLQDITSKLQSLTKQDDNSTRAEPADVERFRSECETTEKCLEMCSQLLSHINGLRLLPVAIGEASRDTLAAGLSTQDLTRAHIMTLSTLKDCSDKLSDTLSQLRVLEEDTKGRLLTGEAKLKQGNIISSKQEVQSLSKEYDSTRQCLIICSDASERASSEKVHVLEDVTIGRNGQQMLIASFGELFDARRVRLDEGAVQVVASLSSDATLRELFTAQNRR